VLRREVAIGVGTLCLLSPAGNILAITTARAAVPQRVITAVLPWTNAEDVGKRHREGMQLAAGDHSAASNVFWRFGVAIKNGKLDEFKALIQEMSDPSRADEPETLIYEWTISDDEKAAESTSAMRTPTPHSGIWRPSTRISPIV
jgi:hypothetical protein